MCDSNKWTNSLKSQEKIVKKRRRKRNKSHRVNEPLTILSNSRNNSDTRDDTDIIITFWISFDICSSFLWFWSVPSFCSASVPSRHGSRPCAPRVHSLGRKAESPRGNSAPFWLVPCTVFKHPLCSLAPLTGLERLIWSHSSARFYFELSGNSN